jgi:endonuclease/exonuclease/phosphatase family metal-dependent hydrolase
MRQYVPIITFSLLAVVFAMLGYHQPPLPSSGFDPDRRIEKRFRVVSWNIGQAGGKPSNAEIIEHVAHVLQSLDADLVFLQEVESKKIADQLRKKLGSQWRMLVAAKKGRTVVALCESGSLFRLDSPINTRNCLWFGHITEEMKTVLVINLHADVYSARRRNRLIGQAATLLSDESRIKARLLGGDLNLDIDLNKRHDLFTDNEQLDVETYNTIAQRFQDAALNAGSTAEPDRWLDYIFLDRSAFVLLQAGPWKGQRIAEMDHDPLIADMQLRGLFMLSGELVR